jgi:hypothetical protein
MEPDPPDIVVYARDRQGQLYTTGDEVLFVHKGNLHAGIVDNICEKTVKVFWVAMTRCLYVTPRRTIILAKNTNSFPRGY